jgi:hypothetical protein
VKNNFLKDMQKTGKYNDKGALFCFWEKFHHLAFKKRNCQSFKGLSGKKMV